MLTNTTFHRTPALSARRGRAPLGRTAAVSAVALVALAGLTGCSVHASISTGGESPSAKQLAADKVATLAEDALEKSVGQRPTVECPDDLTLEKDNTTRCDLTSPSTGKVYGLTVTVEDPAVDGGGLHFQVDQTPKG